MGITDFYGLLNAQFDGGESEGAPISPSPQTLEAVPIASSSDPQASPDAHQSWRPEREAREAFGALGGAHRSDGSRRRARGAAHDLQYEEWAQPKRGRNYVLREFREPSRGAGAPMAGCVVHFPAGLTPHVPQKITMSRILAALTESKNALIESPTGTGKSLALLCSALAWLEKRKAEVRAANEAIAARNAAKTLAFEEACARRRANLRVAARDAGGVKRETPSLKRDPGLMAGRVSESDPNASGARADAALTHELDEALAVALRENPSGGSGAETTTTATNETTDEPTDPGSVSFTLGRPDGLVVPKLADPDDHLSVHVIKNEPDRNALEPALSSRAPPARPAVSLAASEPAAAALLSSSPAALFAFSATNLLGACFFGFAHQSGVVPAVAQMASILAEDDTAAHALVYFWRTYTPPESLLAFPADSARRRRTEGSVSPSHIVDLQGASMDGVLAAFAANEDWSHFYVVAPATAAAELRARLAERGEGVAVSETWRRGAHFSGEELRGYRDALARGGLSALWRAMSIGVYVVER